MDRRSFICGIAFAMALGAGSARADPVEDFYKGKQIEIIVGTGPGGGYDIYARLLAQHISRFVPGAPTAIVRNMPGAGGLRAANHIYQNAPRDGLSIGTFARDIITFGVLGGNANVQYDVRKFNWLGSASSFSTDAYILWARKSSGIATAEEARRSSKPLLMGATAASSSATVPLVLRDALGLNLKVITGYQDSGSVGLAVDRGEVDGQFASFSVIHLEKSHWLAADGPVRPLVQYVRTTRHPLLPDVPTARELAPNDHARLTIEVAEAAWAMSRPFVAPPGVPAERVEALRKAFIAVQNDPAYIRDAERARVDVSPMDGATMLGLINKFGDAPPDILDYMRKLQAAE